MKTAPEQTVIDSSDRHTDDIGFGNVTFSWSNDDASDGSATPSRQAFRLHITDDVLFKKGVFNLIVGPTGCGKTSMLMALLGEMHYIPSGLESWRNLPRERGVAFVAQESWVQSETIKVSTVYSPKRQASHAPVFGRVIYFLALLTRKSASMSGRSHYRRESGDRLFSPATNHISSPSCAVGIRTRW